MEQVVAGIDNEQTQYQLAEPGTPWTVWGLAQAANASRANRLCCLCKAGGGKLLARKSKAVKAIQVRLKVGSEERWNEKPHEAEYEHSRAIIACLSPIGRRDLHS